MGTRKFLGAVVISILVYTINSTTIEGQVAEIPRPFMRGIAQVTMRRGQPVIYYNPVTCRRLGPQVCGFFRAHEYAHLRLGHLHRNISVRQAEAEADVLASRIAPRSSVIAARQWFASGRGGSFFHGTGRQRARRLGQTFSPHRVRRGR